MFLLISQVQKLKFFRATYAVGYQKYKSQIKIYSTMYNVKTLRPEVSGSKTRFEGRCHYWLEKRETNFWTKFIIF